MTNTKFWIAAGVCAGMLVVILLYIILNVGKIDAAVLAVLVGVITVVSGGYFASNLVASGQASK